MLPYFKHQPANRKFSWSEIFEFKFNRNVEKFGIAPQLPLNIFQLTTELNGKRHERCQYSKNTLQPFSFSTN